jgi:hypothetical protein
MLISLSLALLLAFYLDTPHGRSYRVYNLETKTVVKLCDVTFDEIASYFCDVFECAGDKEIEKSIFVDEGLYDIDGDENEPLLPFISSPEPLPVFTFEAEAPHITTSSTVAVQTSRVEGRSSSSRVLPLTFRRHIHLNKS